MFTNTTAKVSPTVSTRQMLYLAAAALLAGAAFMIIADDAEASHFRGGTIQWNHTEPPTEELLPGSGIPSPTAAVDENLAMISGSLAYRCTFTHPTCTTAPPPQGTIVNAVGRLEFGDGSSASNADWQIMLTRIDPGRDFWVGKMIAAQGGGEIPHYYEAGAAPGGMPWQIKWSDFCRVGGNHVNNPCGGEILVSQLNLEDPNKSPVVDLIPLRYCGLDQVCKFPIYARDPDNDTMRYRLSDPCEADYRCKFFQPGPPHAPNAAKIDQDGWVTWNTEGAQMKGECSVYSMQIMVGDGFTDVPEDYMIELCKVKEDLCPDGTPPQIDPETGEPMPCDEEPVDCDSPEHMNEEYCLDDPDPPVDPTKGTPPTHWYYPDPADPVPQADPTVSNPTVIAYEYLDDYDIRVANLDSDGDGVRDRDDLCPHDRATSTQDMDGDGVGDTCDVDADGDGILDTMDDCVDMACANQNRAGLEVAEGAEGARGELVNDGGPDRLQGGATTYEDDEPGANHTGWYVLGFVGLAMVLLLLAVVLRRK